MNDDGDSLFFIAAVILLPLLGTTCFLGYASYVLATQGVAEASDLMGSLPAIAWVDMPFAILLGLGLAAVVVVLVASLGWFLVSSLFIACWIVTMHVLVLVRVNLAVMTILLQPPDSLKALHRLKELAVYPLCETYLSDKIWEAEEEDVDEAGICEASLLVLYFCVIGAARACWRGQGAPALQRRSPQ